MTTIAVKWPNFAADTQLTSGQTIYRVNKLFRLPDGGVASACGEWANAYPALKWLADGEHGDCPEFEDVELLIGRPDGSLWMAEGKWPAYPILGDIAAIGCGAQAAQVAMSFHGKTPRQAVEGVASSDPNTSAPIQTMKVKSL